MAKMYFRLNQGVYYERDKATGKERCFRAGTPTAECIETDKDLVFLLNQQTDPPKFTRIPDHIAMSQMVEIAAKQGFNPVTSNTGPTSPPLPGHGDDTLEGMTIEELQAHAASEEIDLGKAKKKEDILRIIRTASASV